MKIIIKNMICPANLLFVKLELEKLGISYKSIEMGSLELSDNITEEKINRLGSALEPLGLEMEYENKCKMILKIKTAIKDYLDETRIAMNTSLPEYIVKRLNNPYHQLNSLFNKLTGTSIERYFNSKKIDRIIELLIYYNLTLTEISYHLNYNSIEELRNHFKSIVGLSPEHFKQINIQRRNVPKIFTGEKHALKSRVSQ